MTVVMGGLGSAQVIAALARPVNGLLAIFRMAMIAVSLVGPWAVQRAVCLNAGPVGTGSRARVGMAGCLNDGRTGGQNRRREAHGSARDVVQRLVEETTVEPSV
jgi:hypothetical protein